MRLGILGSVLPASPSEITAETLASIREMGFSGVGTDFGFHLEEFTPTLRAHVKALFAESGLDQPMMWAPFKNFIQDDRDAMERDFALYEEAIRLAVDVGCGNLALWPGSHGVGHPYLAHPRNFTQESFDRSVAGLRRLAPLAEDKGISLSIEPGIGTVAFSPKRTREILDAVGSPALKVNLDVVNWITFWEYFDQAPLIEQSFDLVGSDVSGVHLKDIHFGDRLCVHLDEVPAGQGELDYLPLLRRASELPRETYMIIEHVSLEEIPAAREYVLARSREAGVAFV